jgi:hypothetical protein
MKKVGAGCKCWPERGIRKPRMPKDRTRACPLIDHYLMERNAEIALARSAAPQWISQGA